MKKMRKLIPALAMLLVSAVMMSTASFAWFSMNTEAEATGMQIKASSTGGLAIGAWTGTAGAFKTDGVTPDATAPVPTAFASSVAYGWVNNDSTQGAKIQPTSHSNTNGSKWAKASAEKIDASKADSTTYAAAAVSGYYIWTKWDVKSLAEDGNIDVILSKIEISGVSADAAQTNLSKAIRVAVYNSSENAWYYFAPNYASGTTLYYALWDGTSNFTKTAYGTGGINYTTTPNVIVANDVTQTAETLDVYIYFEGEDDNCMSANAASADTITVNLTFTAA